MAPVEHTMKDSTRDTYRQRLLRVLLHIQAHLDDPGPLEKLAAMAHFSSFHFHRVFRGMVGEGVAEHVRRLRMERAAMQLTGTNRSIVRIAMGAGYETHESFTRAFRARFGEPPSEFRRRRGWHRPLQTSPRVPYAPDGRIEDFTPNDTGGRSMEASIKRLEAKKVAFLRHVGPYQEVGPTWGRLCAWAGPRGLLGPDTAIFGLCHDDPEVTPPEKIRYDACIAIKGDLEVDGDIAVQEVSGGDYAVAVHKGPYEGLANFYARFCGEWIPAQCREIRAAPSIEQYLNDPDRTPPEELLVEVHVPLET
jgi:AraC family transcriptional regulator